MDYHRLYFPVFLLLLCCLVRSYVKEAADGSVCFNNCNGHGDCVDYSCHCWTGYHGDDCGSSFVMEGQKVVPILTAGHFNLTRKNFTSAVIKSKTILVGFSAYSCHRCIAVESEYEKIADAMAKLGLSFARADADQLKSIALEHEANELPALVLFQKVRQQKDIILLMYYTSYSLKIVDNVLCTITNIAESPSTI